MIKAIPFRLTSLVTRSTIQSEGLGGGFSPALASERDAPDSSGARSARPFAGRRLMIVEDEYLIGQDLIQGPAEDGMEVLGPFSSVDQALDMIRTGEAVDAAILDLNLRGRISFDLADALIEKETPFVFYTGYESVIVPDKFRMVPRIHKPAGWREIRKALFSGNSVNPRQRLVKRLSGDTPELATLLPVLRRRARQITPNRDMAERLIERTLERAIREIEACPVGTSMEHWLIGLLENTGIGDQRHLN